ncbi:MULTISPECIES: fluoride efflux transporter CrcB [unclassified Rhodococcus (in: high G+C Gram-positive bacteria)]|uniref:fluoride efflux transporter CrcB n=1 Tax=unclassified Rhodococcus (in: high G+C Gram-positive bacteria) TaxID=192944 RepID=UPI000B9BB59F|nr:MULTISPECIES: fluoride efflux transporter CrcB [unclassified Rhodococcus (in: high G+C Gram-positive bacteria)]OZE35523.1 chromosome condensation protein CrcB [Rhodococcus sp. 05-2254-4]OZE47952.1 chromosome condensation protein CrcB [Rhodococcus sp. 05-2254-3]OZE49163.1 chromosome condensation protein CrcB [Rhodococcus sp. 05-2254-2]OZF44545.1 chromosome condensation protein CrcB [Rhodococcus sp. 14-1411-2a]
MIALWIAAAGGLGAVFRFVVDAEVKSSLAARTSFPWATVGINVSGSFLLGVLAGWVMFRAGSTDVQAVIGTGFCGGYTTFSTASVETVRLLQQGRRRDAAVNVTVTVLASVLACAGGLALASSM